MAMVMAMAMIVEFEDPPESSRWVMVMIHMMQSKDLKQSQSRADHEVKTGMEAPAVACACPQWEA